MEKARSRGPDGARRKEVLVGRSLRQVFSHAKDWCETCDG